MAVFKKERCVCGYNRDVTTPAKQPGKCPTCNTIMVISEKWYISYYHAGKRKTEAVSPSHKLAITALAKKKVAIAEGRYLDKRADYTWTDAVGKFRKWISTHTKPKTVAMYENSLKILSPYFDKYYLGQITSEMVDDFKAQRLLTVTNSTVNRDLATIKRLYSLMCDEWRLIERDPMRRVKKLKENPSRIRFLTPDEEMKLLAAVSKDKGRRSTWLRMAVIIALNTGLRKEAITSLRWQDIDRDARFITVKSKGDKAVTVPITDSLMAEIKAYREEQRTGKILSPYLFPSHVSPNRPVRPDIHGSWLNACIAAGLKDFRFHDLRHTFARNFYKRTKDWKALQTILGHSDVSITMRIYVNFNNDDLTAAMRKFQEG